MQQQFKRKAKPSGGATNDSSSCRSMTACRNLFSCASFTQVWSRTLMLVTALSRQLSTVKNRIHGQCLGEKRQVSGNWSLQLVPSGEERIRFLHKETPELVRIFQLPMEQSSHWGESSFCVQCSSVNTVASFPCTQGMSGWRCLCDSLTGFQCPTSGSLPPPGADSQ